MSTNLRTMPTTFDSVKRALGNRSHRTIANNTTATFCADGIHIRLHGHLIVKLHETGEVELNDCGWWTVTTKDRLNRFCPPGIGVFSKRGTPMIRLRDENGELVEQRWTGSIVLNDFGQEVTF